jgi:hypothetical protein
MGRAHRHTHMVGRVWRVDKIKKKKQDLAAKIAAKTTRMRPYKWLWSLLCSLVCNYPHQSIDRPIN